MSPERDDPTDDQELYEDVPPRSIFAATWFRVVLVLIVLGVIGAVAVPYVLDWMNPSPSITAKVPAIPPAAAPPGAPAMPAAEKPGSSAEKKDSTLVPVPAPAPPPAAARPEPAPKPAPSAKAPAPSPKAEPKSAASAPSDAAAKSAMAVTETTPKSAPKSEPPATSAVTKAESAKSEAAAKSDAAAKDDTKTAAAKTPPATRRAVAKATTPAPSVAPATSGPYWVQVGAFKDPETAKRVAGKLREQSFKVEESQTQVGARPATTSPSTPATAGGSPSDQYDVYVSGMPAAELAKKLASKGLTAEPSGTTVVVKPSLPLRDAVTLSKDLAVEGLKVQVRRAGSGQTASATVPAAPPAAGGGDTLHRVRVGGFDDRAGAVAALRELEAKGYKPFIARGDR